MDETKTTAGNEPELVPPHGPSPDGGKPGEPDVARLVLQCAIPFFLSSMKRLEHLSGGDSLSGLLTLGILEANVRHVSRDPVLARRHAQFETPPPDETRRPISARALAASLGVPYDAVRRRVAALEAAGICVRTAKGVYVPSAVLMTEANRGALARSYLAVSQLSREIITLAPGLDLTGGVAAPPDVGPLTAPERLAARITVEYVLRFAERLVGAAGDFSRGLILLAILQHNFEPLRQDPVLTRRYGGLKRAPPDDMLAPISVLALAGVIGHPFETTRRHVNHLIGDRLCARTRGGVIAPAAALQSELAQGLMAAHLGDLQRAFGAMARLGLVFDGKQEPPAARD
ncbi:MAG: hypothetical protein Q7V15_09275 [Phenylobacterium sp.]|uniref:hypothetical protein n=1 Tax=Phenylobacterium sp. TaxID=1871053 RepID=UPI002722FAC2|nr:hypothetical protein [Phenylobacterium sp.]MDO8901532.1 hypothetical protein [Phenylobacterium sp.]